MKTILVSKVFYTFGKNLLQDMDQELKNRIIQNASLLFLQHGIKSVTMDFIAGRLGISKRTLYEVFPDKNTLVMASLQHCEEGRQVLFEELTRSSRNTLYLLLGFYEATYNLCVMRVVLFFTDLERYHPQIAEEYEKEKHSSNEYIAGVLTKGMEEGLIRTDINPHVVAVLLNAQIETLKKSDDLFTSRYTFTEIFETIFKMFLRGISTPEGVRLVDDFMETHKK